MKIISGVVLLGLGLDKKFISSLQDKNIPFVVINDYSKDVPVNYVDIDNVSGGYIATEHLIKNGYNNNSHRF